MHVNSRAKPSSLYGLAVRGHAPVCVNAGWCVRVCVRLPCVLLQALFRSIRARMGQCQLDHFELPCAADMSPLQVSSVVGTDQHGGYTTSSGTQPAAASDGGMPACRRAQGSCRGSRLCRR